MTSKGSKTSDKISKIPQSNTFVSIMAMDEEEFDPDEEKQEEDGFFSSFTKLKEHPTHICIFLQFVMTYYKQPFNLLFWFSTSSIKLSGPKEYRKWAEEIYNMFLSFNSPCYVMLPLDVDTEILESSKNKVYVEYTKPNIFDKMRAAVELDLEAMLADFKNKRSIGMIPFSIDVDPKDLVSYEAEKKKSYKILSQFLEKYASTNISSASKQDFDKANCLVYAIKHYMDHLGFSSTESDDLVASLVDPISGVKVKRNRSKHTKKESISVENLVISRTESMSRTKKLSSKNQDDESTGGSITSIEPETIRHKGSLHKTQRFQDIYDSTTRLYSNRKKFKRDTLFAFGDTADDLFDENDPNFFFNLDLDSTECSNWSETVSKDVLSQLKGPEVDRQETIFELISTERSYIKYLTILQKIFMHKMISEDMISRIHANFLFCNLPEILQFHLPFVKNLIDLKSESLIIKNISSVLTEQFDGSNGESMKRLYGAFCAVQNIGIEALKERRKYDSKLSHFFKIAESLNMCKRLSFNEMHACIYQRITKYPLLFETIRKKTPPDHPDYEGLVKVVELSKSLLTYANNLTHQVENLQKLNLICKQIIWKSEGTGSPIEPEATFDILRFRYIKDAIFSWNKGKTICDINIIILDKCMCMFIKKNEKLYPVESCHTDDKISMLSYDHMIVRENAADEKGFFLLIDSMNFQVAPVIYQLIASSKQERKTWVEFIQGIINSYKAKTLEKETIDLSFLNDFGGIDEITNSKANDTTSEDERVVSSHPLLRRISFLKSQGYLTLDSGKTPSSKFMSKQAFFPD